MTKRTRAAAAALLTAASLLALVAIRFDSVPWLRGPAPYPPEWQWGLRTGDPAPRLGLAALLVVAVLGLLALSSSRAVCRPRRCARALLLAASASAFALPLALLEREPQGALRALMARAVSPSISSYHTVAVSEEARDPLAFLRAHARLLQELARGRKHAATHPPGPVLWYRAALALVERSPALADALLPSAGIERHAAQSEQGRALRAAALLGALALGLVAALTVWPLAALGEALGLEPLPAARVAVLWALLPGPALMTPALDAAIALPVVASALAMARAAAFRSWRATLLGAGLAGLCGALALFASYGAAPLLAIAGAAAAAATERARVVRAALVCVLAALATLALTFGVPALLGQEPVLALRTALDLHRTLFTAPRRYALWLLFNPLDFALFVGLPVAMAAVWALRRSVARAWSEAGAERLDRFRLALAAGMLVLLLAGVSRGEVGRLWIPLMPFVLLAAIGGEGRQPSAAEAIGFGALIGALTITIGSCWTV